MRAAGVTALAVVVLAVAARGQSAATPALLIEGTVVTMDDTHHVLAQGRVLVRDGLILAVWSGPTPNGVSTDGARVVTAGPRGLVFPGLIDLHDHPSYDVLPLWVPPSSHREPASGRPSGREPYDNRYQWNLASPPEYLRLVRNAHTALAGLGLERDVLLHAEAQSALGGETALEGVGSGGTERILIREIEGTNFGRSDVEAWVPSIGDFTDAPALRARIAGGRTRAWIPHLAEGVRDGDRRAGDGFSSRQELDTVRRQGLLTSALVVLHGTAFERGDFAALSVAGAKLVWSPASNLLLYGRTANVYEALAEGVTVALGTDWRPSGSPTLLDELKVADIALRDERILGSARAGVPELASDAALDRELVDMVTRNAAQALGWAEVGSIEPGKHADLLVLRRPARSPTGGMPDSPYRNLIDATQRDVRLLLLEGQPVAGDPDALRTLGAPRVQLVRSPKGGFAKGIVAGGSLAAAEARLRVALNALGGNYTYLRTHWAGGSDRGLTNSAFRDNVLAPLVGRANGKINLGRIELSPLFTADDHFFFTIMGGRRTAAGIPADKRPPYRLYRANFNFIGRAGDPFAAKRFFNRWYRR
jgi:hypothetical protein